MNVFFRYWLILLLTGATACATNTEITNTDTTTNATAISTDPHTTVSQAIPGQPAQQISTEPLNPTPIRITLADLPEPYHTQSVSNSPQVVDIPENPVLQVPAGFTENRRKAPGFIRGDISRATDQREEAIIFVVGL